MELIYSLGYLTLLDNLIRCNIELNPGTIFSFISEYLLYNKHYHINRAIAWAELDEISAVLAEVIEKSPIRCRLALPIEVMLKWLTVIK